LLLVVLGVALAVPATLGAGPAPPDPVEQLREALRAHPDADGPKEGIESRQKDLERRADAVQRLTDLGRALVLQEWYPDVRPGEDVGQVKYEVLGKLATRFRNGVQDVFRKGDALRRVAAANLFGETMANARANGVRGVPVWRMFAELASDLAQATCVCTVAADFDNDGDLDLLLVNFYSNVVLYRNDTNDRSWLRVKAVGTRSNLDGIGAKVSVFGPDGKLVASRHIQSGAGYCRCSPLEAHVGLGKTPAASYRVEVVFPATKTRVVREQVKPGRRIVVEEVKEQ
jgi:hypothetical protein